MADLCNKKPLLKQDLDNFHSFFDFDITNLDKERVETIIKKLVDDRENAPKSKDEDINISNFLSYLYFLVHQKDQALQLLEETLQKDPDNIIANANKARILLENGEVADVEEIVSKLKELEKRNDYGKRKCYAEANLAYAYARSGPWYHQRAVYLYSRLVEAYPTEYAWQFGLGLTLLRQTHHFHSQTNIGIAKTMIHAAESLLAATKSDEPILCAIAYAELGRAVYTIKKKCYDQPPEIEKLNYMECFEKALEICPEEPSVLQISGQYARYKTKIDLSEKLLRESLRRKPTPQGYHHLALTLKRKVEMNGEHSTERNRPEESVDQDGFTIVKRKEKKKSSHPPDEKRRELRQMIKSPLKVQIHPGNKSLVEAIDLIDKAIELDPCILNIQYDKGILYRMLGETANAVNVFKYIISKRKTLPTKTLMINVNEQLGLCLLELSDSKEIPPDEKTKYKKDGQSHLSHALQLQSEIVANDPHFKEALNSYSTLKELLSDESEGKPKQLAVLHMLMADHRDSIAIYKELNEEDKMEPDDCKNMLECYTKVGQFEECVTLLSSWECTTIFARLPESLIFDVYIKGAFHAFSTNNAQIAYKHFRRAFKVYDMFNKDTHMPEVDEEEKTKDILILHYCSEDWRCEFPKNLGKILEDCTGLRYTINTDDVLGNAITTESMVSMMKKIPCIIIMTHDSSDNYDQFYVNHALLMSSRKGGPRVLVVSDDNCNVPDIARTMAFIRAPPSLEGAIQPPDKTPDQVEEKRIEWVREFIYLLKDHHRK